MFPPEYTPLLSELLFCAHDGSRRGFEAAVVAMNSCGRGDVLHLIHLVGAAWCGTLAVYELVIGGDLWDRGPRGDRVVDYLRQLMTERAVYLWQFMMRRMGSALGA